MLCDDLLNKLYCGVYEMGNDDGIRFQKVEPRLDVCELDQNRPYVVCLNC